ncbi:hypothetical protein Ocin01_17301 [Orchesella cincta]|uniref:Uncharacterized protein n=1 Tax=Orchesella cincta TaxID=48709 RepID=A0A1D2M8T0_ORCCI|nr:hypothetical protein Ocin01_17301 [Orchesella cincta]
MKFLKISIVLLVCFGVLVSAQKNEGGKSKEDKEDEDDRITYSPGRGRPSGGRNNGGRCSCRDLQDQTDSLELRLDRMVETWNDFVDKNRIDGPPGPVRRPPQGGIGGGRGPYTPGRSMNNPSRYFEVGLKMKVVMVLDAIVSNYKLCLLLYYSTHLIHYDLG